VCDDKRLLLMCGIEEQTILYFQQTIYKREISRDCVTLDYLYAGIEGTMKILSKTRRAVFL
jgi:hypothetical protein